MKIRGITLALLSLVISGCGTESAVNSEISRSSLPPCMAGRGVTGGWSQQDEPSDEAIKALNFVLEARSNRSQLKRITQVRSQVVAGVNYAIEFELDNGETWNTVVFRDLKGSFEITQPAKKGGLARFCS